jgi:hypothetical protein
MSICGNQVTRGKEEELARFVYIIFVYCTIDRTCEEWKVFVRVWQYELPCCSRKCFRQVRQSLFRNKHTGKLLQTSWSCSSTSSMPKADHFFDNHTAYASNIIRSAPPTLFALLRILKVVHTQITTTHIQLDLTTQQVENKAHSFRFVLPSHMYFKCPLDPRKPLDPEIVPSFD